MSSGHDCSAFIKYRHPPRLFIKIQVWIRYFLALFIIHQCLISYFKLLNYSGTIPRFSSHLRRQHKMQLIFEITQN